MIPSNDPVAIGVLRRPHGLNGALKVLSYSGETKHFSALREVELRRDTERRRGVIVAVEIHNATPVVYFAGVDDPERAREMAGYEIWVSREKAAPLEEGEYYVTDLIGMKVVTVSGFTGTIESVVEGSQAPLLEVRRETGTVLIPFMDPFMGVPDQQARTVELLAPWILDTE